MDRKIKNILLSIANKHGISLSEALIIYNTQFEEAAETIQSATPNEEKTFKNIMLPKFGKLVVKPYRLKYFVNNKDSKET